MTHLIIGSLAPDFTLQRQDGEQVSLADYRDKMNVVVYFYPKALTPGCTFQACGIRDSQQALADRDTVVLGISPDPYPRLQKFIDKHGLNFDLLSDEDHAIAEQYGIWQLKKFMGREYMGIVRTTFIIGKDGCLKEVMTRFKTKTHHNSLLASLDQHF